MWKKILTITLAIALVVTSLHYIPGASAKADTTVNWNDVAFAGDGAGGGAYANKYKFYSVDGKGSLVNIQKPGFAEKPGFYVTYNESGAITSSSLKTYYVQGAGIVIALENFTKKVTYFTITAADGTHECAVYYADGTDDDSSNPQPTETTTQQDENKDPDSTDPPQGPEPTLLAPTKVAAYNFYAKNKGYQVVFTKAENAVSYNVYMDNSSVLTTVSASDEYINADVFSAYADGNLHNLYLQSVDEEGNVSEKSSAAKIRVTNEALAAKELNGISAIYVVTNSDEKIVKPVKTQASLTVISGDSGIKNVNYAGTIKLRGNSTSIADKPAYNIAFDKKQEVMVGRAKGKKWSLLANAYEKTMIRNKLAMDFGAILGGVATPKEYFTDLYIDGKYMGVFVMSEPAENERSDVSYNEDGDDILFELESERDESSDGAAVYYRTSKTGSRFVTEDLEDDVDALVKGGTPATEGAIRNAMNQNSPKFVKMCNTLESFEAALVNTNSNDVFNYINMESFVDMYVINELFQTVDFGYSSVKFYITYDEEGNGTINAGPLWDFDLSSGNSSFADNRSYNTFRGQNVNAWFRYLMQNKKFKEAVIKKYTDMQPYIQNLYKDNGIGTNQIDANVSLINDARIKNYSPLASGGAGWSESVADSAEYSIYPYSYSTVAPYSNYTYSQHVEYLRTWLTNRNTWLCSQWGIDMQTAGVLKTTSEDIDITGYQMTSRYNNIENAIGLRVVYQAEDLVNGMNTTEVGLVYGLNINGNMTADDLVVGSSSEYVVSYKATDAGKMETKMGTSKTATYYSMTMNTSVVNGTPTKPNKAAYTTTYMVRPYAKLSTGVIVYGEACSYTVFKVADHLYKNSLITNKATYDCLYENVLKYVDSTYQEGDFDWNNTIVKLY